MKIGFLELVLVFVVALLAIGPDKLPSFAQKLGAALREFRKATADMSKDVRENVIEPLEEAQRPIRDAIEPLAELDREVRQDIQSIEKGFKNIGKQKISDSAKREVPPAESSAPPDFISAQEQQTDEDTGGEST